MGKREGVFCDFTNSPLNGTCPNLAIGACVLCERDVCRENHSFLRDKFVRPSEAEGRALSITIGLSHVSQTSQSVENFHQPQKIYALVCCECGSRVPGSRVIDAVMTALIKSLRSELTKAALTSKKEK